MKEKDNKGILMVCPKCWRILGECSCKNSKRNAIQIDEGMYPIISDLNIKGYTTSFCCEGHWTEKYNCYMGAYIYFNKAINKTLFPKLLSFPWKPDNVVASRMKTPFMTAGIGYKNKFAEMEEQQVFYWTGTRYKRMKKEEKDKEHQLFLAELKKWVDELPKKI